MSYSSREAWRNWWDEEGSRMRPLYGEDNEQFARQMTEIAWENGAFWRRPDIDRLRAELVTTKDELAAKTDELAAMREQLVSKADELAAMKQERDALQQRVNDFEWGMEVARE